MYEDIPTFLFLSLSGFMRGVFLVLRWYFSSPKRRHPGSKFDGGQEDKEQRKFFDLVAITFQKAIPPLDGDTFYAATNLIFEEYRVQKLLLFTNSFLCVRARKALARVLFHGFGVKKILLQEYNKYPNYISFLVDGARSAQLGPVVDLIGGKREPAWHEGLQRP